MVLPEDRSPRGRAVRITAHAAALLLAAALAGCTAIDEQALVLPQATVVKGGHASAAAVTAASAEGPRQTGIYPSFAEPLRAANTQMDNDQAAKLEARLSALGHARMTGQVSEAEYQRRLAELRKLASEHGPAAQKAIAN